MLIGTDLLGSDGPFDLPLIVLLGLTEHGEQDDSPLRGAPIRYPDRDFAKPDSQLPNLSFKVIRPRPAQTLPFLREESGDLVHSLEVAITKAVQPVTNLCFEFEVIEFPHVHPLFMLRRRP